MHSTMMRVPLNVSHLLERGRHLFGQREIISARANNRSSARPACRFQTSLPLAASRQ